MIEIKRPAFPDSCVDVDLNALANHFYNAMGQFWGRDDLGWIPCLFDEFEESNLYGRCVRVNGGTFEPRRVHPRCVEDMLLNRRVYSDISRLGNHKAHLNSSLPEGFDMYVLGPNHSLKSLELLGVAPIITSRDAEERRVLEEIHGKMEEFSKGKHQSVEGRLIIPRDDCYPVVIAKTFEPPIDTTWNFGGDIEDFQVFARAYQNFLDYQKTRDSTSESIGVRLFDVARDGD